MNFYLHAWFSTVLACLLFLFLIKEWLRRDVRKAFLLAGISIPLCPVINLFIKKPFFTWAFSLFHLKSEPEFWPWWFLAISLFVAPITEEGGKILPVVAPAVRNELRDKLRAYGAGFSLGFGFGIGEIWYLAWRLTRKMPAIASGPLWELIGFSAERLLASFVHAFLTAIVVTGLAQKKGIRAYLIAVAFHALVNLGATLYQAKKISGYVVGIPMMISMFLLLHYAFQVERKIRESTNMEKPGMILFKRDSG